jgi:ABC-type multidrug transport system fused ATPase/permease subunit
VKLSGLMGSIEFVNVSFYYPSRKMVILNTCNFLYAIYRSILNPM